jgi:hypothetical protein
MRPVVTDDPAPGASGPDEGTYPTRDDLARRAARRVEQERQELLATWLDGGGTEAEFEEAWPAIRTQLGKVRVDELGDKARGRSLGRFRKQP